MTSEAGHAIGIRYFSDWTKKLSKILERRPIFVPKLWCCLKKKGLRLESVSDF